MTPIRILWFFLCVLGIVLPLRYFLPWLAGNGWSVGGMVDAWHAYDASSGFVRDLTVAAITLTVWICWESRARRDWLGLVAVPATCIVRISFGVPLNLFLRSR